MSSLRLCSQVCDAAGRCAPSGETALLESSEALPNLHLTEAASLLGMMYNLPRHRDIEPLDKRRCAPSTVIIFFCVLGVFM